MSSDPEPSLATSNPLPTPIHQLSTACNPQNDSILFNGRIPAEIRDGIFYYALTEYTQSDRPYSIESGQYRPGYQGPKAVTAALLRTCRRIYLETYHLPPSTKEHIFWHAPHTGPYGEKYQDVFNISHERAFFQCLTSWQLPLVKEIHLFLQMYWLEQSFMMLCNARFMHGIEKLKITIRRGDWWWCERGYPLGINAPRGNGNVEQMKRDIIAEKAGEVIPWDMMGWGGALAHLPAIKELEMEFETVDQQKDELIAVVNRAKTWRFPLKNGMVLCAKGSTIGEKTWTKAAPCPQCGKAPTCDISVCKRTVSTKTAVNVEPLLHIRTVKWKLAKLENGR
jgi:hypothetical protein